MLSIKDLHVRFAGPGYEVAAVAGVSLDIESGRTLAVIGESGSGKSIMGLSICNLLPGNASVSGQIVYDGMRLDQLERGAMRRLRGRRIAFVPQSAGLSLNPTMQCGGQVSEVFHKRKGYGARDSRTKAGSLFTRLGLTSSVFGKYAHALSGGMRQRVLVSIGLAGSPDLLIADEPTKGIDAARRGDVEDLFLSIRENNPGMAILLITHDLNLAERASDEIAVMYAGTVVERAASKRFFADPRHPYSVGLLAAMPERGLTPLPGMSPRPSQRPSGCVFHPRCAMADDYCRDHVPFDKPNGDGLVRCWNHVEA